MTTEMIPIHLIRRDGGTQSRAAINPDVVAEYAELMTETAGASPFPAVRVVFDGEAYWLWDGFHRIEAAARVGWRDIETEIRPGTRRDAVLLSCGANADHGLRRSNADKRRAVETLLRDPEWGKWSDREIARRTGVEHKMVGRIRGELSLSGAMPQIERIAQRGGSVYTMKTPARPGKPLEELEHQTGDEGETGLGGGGDETAATSREVTSPAPSPAHRRGGLGDPNGERDIPPSRVPDRFIRPLEDLRLAIGEARKNNWATISKSDARRLVGSLLDLINLE